MLKCDLPLLSLSCYKHQFQRYHIQCLQQGHEKEMIDKIYISTLLYEKTMNQFTMNKSHYDHFEHIVTLVHNYCS